MTTSTSQASEEHEHAGSLERTDQSLDASDPDHAERKELYATDQGGAEMENLENWFMKRR